MSSDEDNVDILSLITGQTLSVNKKIKNNLTNSDHNNGSSEIYASAWSLIPSSPEQIEGEKENFDLTSTSKLLVEDSDEEFNLSLPPVFQTEGIKNDQLAKRNRQLTEEIEKEKLDFENEYLDLVFKQNYVLDMLNDNGSNGKIVFLLSNNKDLVNGIVKQLLKGSYPKKHYYFYGKQRVDGNEVSLELFDKLATKIGGEMLIIDLVEIAINSNDILLLLRMLDILDKTVNSSEKLITCSVEKFDEYLLKLGGNIDKPTGRKILYYNYEAEVILIKASIISKTIPLFKFENFLFERVLQWIILSLCDYFNIKNHFPEFVDKVLGSMENVFSWGKRNIDNQGILELLEKQFSLINDDEITSTFLNISYKYYFKHQPNLKGAEILFEMILKFVFGENSKETIPTLSSIERILNIDFDDCHKTKYQILLLPMLISNTDQQFLPVLQNSRNAAHDRLGQLSTGKNQVNDKQSKLQDISAIYDILDFLVLKLEHRTLQVDLFYD